MIYRLTVPGPIKDASEVRVLEWHGAPGHLFAPGELIVELETHKALVEVRAAQPGCLRAIHRAAGDWCEIGRTLAVLSDGPNEPLPDATDDLDLLAVAFDVS